MNVRCLYFGVFSLFFAFFASTSQAEEPTFIVKMKDGNSYSPTSRSLTRRSNLRSLSLSLQSNNRIKKTELPHLGVMIVKGNSFEVRSELEQNPLVEYIEKNVKWKPANTALNQPSNLTSSPHFRDVLGFSAENPDPYLANNSNNSVIVAVIDTGANINHPYLKEALSVNTAELNGRAGVDDDNNGFVDDIYGANTILNNGDLTEEGTDHGSHVSGLVKAVRDQSIYLHSKARQVEILPIRFIGSNGEGSTVSAMKALNYAASRGAKVINASWGALGQASYSQALFETMADLYYQDISIVAAAGNSSYYKNNNNDNTPFFPASLSPNIPGMLSVASLNPEYSGSYNYLGLDLSPFSNFGGSTVDIAAPGSFQISNYGFGVLSANAHYSNTSNSFIRKEGTSMAAPIVAGVLAVVRALNPNLTAFEAKKVLMDSSRYHQNLHNKVRADGFVHAADAYNRALSVVSTSSFPKVSSPDYSLSNQSDSSLAGCGVTYKTKNNQDNIPWGGNGLGFVLALMLAVQHIRKQKLKST